MKFLKHGAVYILANLASASIPFLLLPILTRYLGPEEYGRLAIFQLLCSVFVVLCGTFLVSFLKRRFYEAADSEMPYSSYVVNCIFLASICSCLIAILLLFTADLISSILLVPKYIIYSAALYGFLIVIVQIRLNQWQIRQKPIFYGVFQSSNALINGLLSIVLVFLVFESVAGRIVGQVGSALVLVFAAAFTIRTFPLSSVRILPSAMIEMLRYGSPLIPHLLAGGLLMTVDRAIIVSELTLVDAGIYMAAFQLARGLGVMFDGVNKAISPLLFEFLSSGDETEVYKVVRRTYIYCCLSLVLSISVGLFFEYSVVFFLGNEFSSAADIILCLCVGFGFKAWYLTFSNILLYHGKTITISCISVSVSVLAVFLALILIKSHGLFGVALAFALSMLARALSVYVFSWRNVSPSHLFGVGLR